ncbi:hypothetical protein M409DRAFT_63753 [Zasmidium cellare ATCC 36951]|uniref:L-serine ammonia-lyase n=1 Tax=Zasmidium cellare ATCC 36951 TaxID=1080233 RepID=A0A6A6CWK9_ZASCE|nr:uncharacterized protein M409DRAFT_63753 [Zasmidium cellare ATCC 36951]KAF2171514.1 hypothetical protein M409DRAFT_63753 [Zasmidium cellare ATCC 36951]
MEDIKSKQPWIETPLVWSRRLSKLAGCNIYLKLENTQPSGSFKSRGMSNFVRAHLPENTNTTTHFFCSSGGNAGLGCVSAAVTYNCPATIVVPLSTSAYMIDKIKDAGATEVIQKGASWYEADQHLRNELLPAARERGEKAVYVPPFDDPVVWEGHSSLVDEVVRQLPEVDKHYPSNTDKATNPSITAPGIPDAIICSVGGGGLLNGIMQGLERHSAWRSPNNTKVLAVETVGANALSESVNQGELITLPEITSIATTLGARRVSAQTFTYAMNKERVRCAVLSDKEAIQACKNFANDERILVEPACAVSLAVVYSGKLKEYLPDLKPESRVVVVVCGGSGLSVEILNGYIKKYLD